MVRNAQAGVDEWLVRLVQAMYKNARSRDKSLWYTK